MKARQGSVYCNNIIIITDPKVKSESSLTVFTLCKSKLPEQKSQCCVRCLANTDPWLEVTCSVTQSLEWESIHLR